MAVLVGRAWNVKNHSINLVSSRTQQYSHQIRHCLKASLWMTSQMWDNFFCRCLWFVLEPLIGRTEDYNYAFLRRMIEKIKQTKDIQGPDDEAMNKVGLFSPVDLAWPFSSHWLGYYAGMCLWVDIWWQGCVMNKIERERACDKRCVMMISLKKRLFF